MGRDVGEGRNGEGRGVRGQGQQVCLRSPLYERKEEEKGKGREEERREDRTHTHTHVQGGGKEGGRRQAVGEETKLENNYPSRYRQGKAGA